MITPGKCVGSIKYVEKEIFPDICLTKTRPAQKDIQKDIQGGWSKRQNHD